tara:strand:+ start:320 stop:709 length:390 start_codon:yes stop_codon:yes gene_type:complete
MSQARKEPIVNLRKVNLFSGLTAIASMSTLICCALPAFLVFIGAGSLLIVFISFFPQFPMISQYKIEIFVTSLIIILLAGIAQLYAKKLPCPTDETQALSCRKIRKRSLQIFIGSLILYLTGFYFAFLI